MNLYEKLLETEPGKHAHAIGEAIYRARDSLGKAHCDALTKVRTYLEKLAIDEITEAEPWAAELVSRGE